MPDKPNPSPRPFSLSDVGRLAGASPTGPAAPTPKPAASLSTPQRLSQARAHIAAKRHAQALDLLAPLLKKKKPDPPVDHLASLIYAQYRQHQQALEHARRANRANPNDISRMIIARAYRGLGKIDDALRWADEALRTNPDKRTPVVGFKAETLEAAGRIDDAEAILSPLIEQAQHQGEPIPLPLREVWARVLVQRKAYPEAITTIDTILDEAKPKPEANLSPVLYLKAKAHDRNRQYPQAWEAARRANEYGAREYNPDLHTQQVDALIEIWSNTDSFPRTRCDSPVPVFVAGMPRSGTSLIDQIIDAHPHASGVGELAIIEQFATKLSAQYNPEAPPEQQFGSLGEPEWQRAADEYISHITSVSPKGTQRVVNKALGNNKLLGLIARLFPNARVIHAIRDPRDVAISCFMGGFNNDMHPWTTRAEWVAHTWSLSQRMMDHWKATLDIPILDVHYERLVANPEHEFPRLIEFLGLDFDPSCYDFHKSKRVVRTLSYDQVNRPLYTSSSGRHKNYEQQLTGTEFPPYTC